MLPEWQLLSWARWAVAQSGGTHKKIYWHKCALLLLLCTSVMYLRYLPLSEWMPCPAFPIVRWIYFVSSVTIALYSPGTDSMCTIPFFILVATYFSYYLHCRYSITHKWEFKELRLHVLANCLLWMLLKFKYTVFKCSRNYRISQLVSV